VLRPLVVVALSACGRIGFDPTGSDPSATTVTTYVQATLGPLRVNAPSPISGVLIVIGDADGRLQDTFVSTGGADAVMIEPGWMISALYPPVQGSVTSFIQVVSNVAPGDKLSFGSEAPLPVTVLGTMTVDLAAVGMTYTLGGFDCGAMQTGAMAFSMQSFEGCAASSFDLLATADFMTPSAKYAKVPVTFTDGGNVNISSFAAAPTLTLTAQGVPANRRVSLSTFTTHDTMPIDPLQQVNIAAPAPSTVTTTFNTQHVTGDYRRLTVGIERADLNSSPIQSRAYRVPIAQGDTTLTVSELPWIATAMLDPQGTTIGYVGGGAHEITTWRIDDVRGNNEFYWFVAAPADVTRVPFPELPAAYADWLPTSGDMIDVEVSTLDMDVWPDYRAAKRTPLWLLSGVQSYAFTTFGATEVGESDGSVGYYPL
jgi:hypothetical protein